MEDGGGRQEQADMQAEEAGRGRRPACLHTQPEREAEVSRAGGERGGGAGLFAPTARGDSGQHAEGQYIFAAWAAIRGDQGQNVGGQPKFAAWTTIRGDQGQHNGGQPT